MSKNIQIIDSKKEDLINIAKCHISAFPKSFSSKLGIKYCQKMLEWYLSTNKAFLFHIEENKKCIGYCGGIINDGTLSTGSSSAMTQYSFNQGVKSLLLRPWLFFHKEMIKNYRFLLKNILMKFRVKKVNNTFREKKNKKNPSIGLVVIGVDKKQHSKGYGSILLQEFEKRATLLNISTINLSVKANNKKAIRAYKKNGWIIQSKDNNSCKMIKKLDFN